MIGDSGESLQFTADSLQFGARFSSRLEPPGITGDGGEWPSSADAAASKRVAGDPPAAGGQKDGPYTSKPKSGDE